jgi:hypothetical protein
MRQLVSPLVVLHKHARVNQEQLRQTLATYSFLHRQLGYDCDCVQHNIVIIHDYAGATSSARTQLPVLFGARRLNTVAMVVRVAREDIKDYHGEEPARPCGAIKITIRR